LRPFFRGDFSYWQAVKIKYVFVRVDISKFDAAPGRH
jgi:hypothetical protein